MGLRSQRKGELTESEESLAAEKVVTSLGGLERDL